MRDKHGRSLVIAVDVDDTLVKSYPELMAFVAQVYGLDYEDLIMGAPSYDVVMDRYPMALQAMAGRGDEILRNEKAIDGAAKYLRKLRNDGHIVLIATARNALVFRDAKAATEETLYRLGIPYDKLYYSLKDKGAFCAEYDVDVLVDDSIENCLMAQRNGKTGIVFAHLYNEGAEDAGLMRAQNWKEVYRMVTEMAKA